MKKYFLTLKIISLAFSLHLPCSPLAADPGPSFVSLSRSLGELISANTPFTGVEILAFPFQKQAILPFFNIKSFYFDKGAGTAANIGGGVRVLPESSNFLYGLNLFYDYRNAHRKSFNRLGLGFELLGEIFGFRANGYVPIGTTHPRISRCVFNNYIGGYFMIRNKFLSNQGGADFLVDAQLKDLWGMDVYLGIGAYYYFKGKKTNSNVFGPEYRVTMDFFRYLSIGAHGTYDNVFGNKFQATLTVTIPLGDLSDRELGPFQRVMRNDLMVLQKRCCWKTNF